MNTRLLTIVLAFLAMSQTANAFVLKCKATDSSYFMTGGYLVLDCSEKKTGIKFYSEALEAGPGLRITKYDDDGNVVNKKLTVVCPFMRAKKLENMKPNQQLVIAGPVVDADLFFGGRLGLEFGRPGVCFTVGYSTYEFGVEAGMSFLHLYRAP